MEEPNLVSDSSDEEGIDCYIPRAKISKKKWEADKLDSYFISRTNPPAKFILP